MLPPPPRSTRPFTLLPYPTRFRSKVCGSITLANGAVTTRNDWIDGLLGYRGTITTDGTVIQTDGHASTGVKAWRETSGYPGAASSVTLTGGSVTTLGSESYGLLAQNAGSTVTASNLSVTTQGSQSFGVNAYNGGDVTLSNVNIITNGDSAHGLVVGSMSDTMRPGSDGKVPTVARSEEHTSDLQSLMRLSYAVFCLKKKKN